MKPGNFSFQKGAVHSKKSRQKLDGMDSIGSNMKNSETRKIKRNFRPKASSMFGLDGEAQHSLGQTMSTQKVPPAVLKGINTQHMTGGETSRATSREDEGADVFKLESKMDLGY